MTARARPTGSGLEPLAPAGAAHKCAHSMHTHEIYLVAHTVDLKHWPQLSIGGGKVGGRDKTQITGNKAAGRAPKSF